MTLLAAPRAASADERIDINKIRGPKIEELAMLIISNPDAQITVSYTHLTLPTICSV